MKDLRVQRTYILLKEAFFKLLAKKPFEEIKVNDICNLAMIHRTTFYHHFQDKYDLLDFCIQDIEQELIDNIIEIYKARKILSKKDLKYAIQKSIDYRYNRLIEDYEKYGNFTLPHVPLKYLKKEKYAKVSRNFAKFLKHFKTFCKPLTNFINWIVQPFSILYYLVSLIFSFILFLIGKKEV